MLMPFIAQRQSAWSFDTFGSGGFALGAGPQGGMSLGLLRLISPQGVTTDFWYGGVGGGYGVGGKIKLGKINVNLPGSAAVGPTAFLSKGILYLGAGQKQEPSAS